MEPPDDGKFSKAGDRRASRTILVLAALSMVAILAASFVQGPPDKLPTVALGWPVILYLERAGLVAFLIMGLGGLGYRLARGDQVKQAGTAGQTVGLEEATKPTEALKEGVDEDIRTLSERVTEVERKTTGLKPDGE